MLPTSVLGRFAAEANDVFAGTTSDIWIVRGSIPLPAQSYFPLHALSLQGIEGKPGEAITRRFTVGSDPAQATAAIKNLGVFTNPSVGERITVGGLAYRFVPNNPANDEIAIGATENDTARNIVTAVNEDTNQTLCTAIASENILTLIANTPGVDFLLVGDGVKIPAQIVTPNATATPGSKAQAKIRIQGDRRRARTFSQILANLPIGSRVESIQFQFETPSGLISNFDLALGLQQVFKASINNTLLPPGGYIIPSDPKTTREEIAVAMAELFSSASSFIVDSDTLILQAGSIGANGNNIALEVATFNSLPDPMIDADENGYPQVDGVARNLGAQDAFQAVYNPQTIDINASNFRSLFAKKNVGGTLEISFKLFQDDNLDFVGFGQSRAAVSYDGKNNVLLLDGAPLTERFTLIFVAPSRRVGGKYDILVIYAVEAGGLTINRARNQANGLDVKIFPIAANRQGDPVGYLKQARQL